MLKLFLLLAAFGIALGFPPRMDVSVRNGGFEIVGGKNTTIDQHPFQISLQYQYQHFCGGFLISSKWVVSAAHCITLGYRTNLNIRAGSTKASQGGQTALVDRYILHPNYDEDTSDFDIVLLELKTPIDHPHAKSAVLPVENQEVPDGVTATVTGWGATRVNGQGVESLLQAQLPTVNRKKCNNDYSKVSPITENMFCAGVGGKDACQGDSGGPVEVNGEIVGIVSWGVGCADPRYPGVFAQVSRFRKWIKSETKI